jgi:hypothetical protein
MTSLQPTISNESTTVLAPGFVVSTGPFRGSRFCELDTSSKIIWQSPCFVELAATLEALDHQHRDLCLYGGSF